MHERKLRAYSGVVRQIKIEGRTLGELLAARERGRFLFVSYSHFFLFGVAIVFTLQASGTLR